MVKQNETKFLSHMLCEKNELGWGGGCQVIKSAELEIWSSLIQTLASTLPLPGFVLGSPELSSLTALYK